MNIQSFRRKIGLLVGAALLALAFLAAFSLTQERNLIVSARRNMLVTAVQTAQSVVRDYQARAANGSMSVEDAQKAARETLRTARYGGADGKTEYFYIWSTEGAAVMHPFKPEWEGKVMAGKLKDGDGIDIVTQLMDAMRASHDGTAFVMTRFPRPGQTEPLPKLQYVKKVDGWDWMVGSGLYTDDLDTQVRDTLIKDLALGGVMLFLLGAIGTVVLRSVLRQIGGEPSQAMAVISEVATGNLDTEVPQAHAGSMIDQLGHMVESLRTLVTNVRSATENIATASSEIAQGNTDLSHRTEQTASYLQTTASSMEQLTSTVQQTSASAQTANQLATSAAAVAQRGGEVVSRVVSTMQEINASSQKISDIIGVIDGIAFQTNILALNAAVEAARAGDQGRGFAVVAGEVRSLAQRSADAAKEIKSLINASVEKVESGTELVGNAGRTMTEIVTSVQQVSDIIGEIRSATSEQSQGIAQVNESIVRLDQMTQQNAALVEQSAAAATSMRDQAMRLTDTVSIFRVQGRSGQTHSAPATPARVSAPPRPVGKAPLTSRPALAVKPAARPTPPAPARVAPPSAKPAAAPAADGDWETF